VTKHAAGERLGRHRHVHPYAALVLQGGYLEAGDCGRFTVEAGHVILHGPFESHQDVFTIRGAVVLNLPVSCDAGALARIEDPDVIVRLAERDRVAAGKSLLEGLVIQASRCADWPDQLCQRIIRDPDVDLGEWARQFGLTPQSLSRGFRKAYGMTPKRFRAEQRALRALRALPNWQGSCASLAVELGFADQAHMIKAIRSIAGRPPKGFR
jgi:AraC-like DNA-binding protein